MWPDVDTIQGKLKFQGNNEILSTEWLTDVDPKTIDGKCKVHEMRAYQRLKVAGPDDFICRSKYYSNQRSYLRQEFPVYCLCRWPAHPDYPMIFCDKCKDWFHAGCVGLKKKSEVDNLRKEDWLCPKCRLTESAS